mgnify:CR=1 FL=1
MNEVRGLDATEHEGAAAFRWQARNGSRRRWPLDTALVAERHGRAPGRSIVVGDHAPTAERLGGPSSTVMLWAAACRITGPAAVP